MLGIRRQRGGAKVAFAIAAIAAITTAIAGCRSSSDAPPLVSGLDARPVNTACVAPRGLSTPVRLVPAFPGLTLPTPILLEHHPTEAFWYALDLAGQIVRFADDPGATRFDVVVDLVAPGIVHRLGWEDGLLGFAFDPAVATNRRVYLKYTARSSLDGVLRLVVARARLSEDGSVIDPITLEELFSLDGQAPMHHGGTIRFGVDGLLYVPIGDGTEVPNHKPLDPRSYQGKILRLDVRSGSRSPTVDVFAMGFRNPHGWSFDPDGKSLWVGDVGAASYEEIDHVVLGGNYGWPVREGAHCYESGVDCDSSAFIDPVHEVLHEGPAAIVVGPIYRGTRRPESRGRLLFTDFMTGRVEELVDLSGKAGSRVLVESGITIASIAEDREGEPLLVSPDGIFRLEPNDDVATMPALLSQTGCVDVTRPRAAANGTIPYDVNMPLWSDGAEKARAMALPEGAQIKLLDDGAFEMPNGSVLVKSFFFGPRPIETRLLVRRNDGDWAGYSYAWRDDAKDAVLLEAGDRRTIDGRAWTFPSRAQCMSCHTAAAGRTLGLEVAQLNGTIEYPGKKPANQLSTLEHIEVLPPLPPLGALPRFPARDDTRASDAEWSRAYLHANCSHCHRPSGPGGGRADLLAWAPQSGNFCDEEPLTTLGIDGARLLAPGHPDSSIMLVRMSRTGASRMPPLATGVIDALAVQRVGAWIAGTRACD